MCCDRGIEERFDGVAGKGAVDDAETPHSGRGDLKISVAGGSLSFGHGGESTESVVVLVGHLFGINCPLILVEHCPGQIVGHRHGQITSLVNGLGHRGETTAHDPQIQVLA